MCHSLRCSMHQGRRACAVGGEPFPARPYIEHRKYATTRPAIGDTPTAKLSVEFLARGSRRKDLGLLAQDTTRHFLGWQEKSSRLSSAFQKMGTLLACLTCVHGLCCYYGRRVCHLTATDPAASSTGYVNILETRLSSSGTE